MKTLDITRRQFLSGLAAAITAIVVTLKLREMPAMTTVATVVVLQLAEALCRTLTVWPPLIVPAKTRSPACFSTGTLSPVIGD